MKRMTYTFILGVLLMALSACGLPTTRVESGGQRPTLAIIGAPVSSQLVLDGRVIGDAGAYNGVDQVLTLEEGYHEVQIKSGTTLRYTEKIYVSTGEMKRVHVGASVK
ncbi:MAG: hypothetical protein LBG61_00095 [Burkholderiales bacterium]|jgi:hypothetical protein|nr:hypothetical protein [Burkholderiales bacterium]